MHILIPLATTILVVAFLRSQGYSLHATIAGSLAILAMLYAFAYSTTWIERWTGRKRAQSNRSDATYFGIAIGGAVGFSLLWPDAGYVTTVLAFLISVTLGLVVSHLCFGERKPENTVPFTK